jgi:NAD(P)H-dependent FMN reductase
MITPLLKNTVDWCSRADDDPFEGKVVAVLSASPGMFGGVRSLQQAQQLFLKMGCHVVPGQCVLPHADKAFSADGSAAEPRTLKSAQALAKKLVLTATRLMG